jgi:uncharacterized membrane protein
MTWTALVVVSVAAFLQKYLGYQVPQSWYDSQRLTAVIAGLPVGLLAALIAVSTLSTNSEISVDARLIGLGAAFIALLLRAPFLLVLVVAAATAATARALGWAA